MLSEKNIQIQILQSNLNTLSNQLESMNYLKKTNQKMGSQSKATNQVLKPIDENTNAEKGSNKDLVFFDKHIINPIRGGINTVLLIYLIYF